MTDRILATVFTDIHVHDYKKFNADDSRLQNTLNAIEAVYKFNHRNNIKYILNAGDWTDQNKAIPTKVTNLLISKIMELTAEYPEIKVITISGNHDQATIRRPHTHAITFVDTLVTISKGNITSLDLLQYIDIENIRVHGIPYYEYTEDLEIALQTAYKNIDTEKINILLTHQVPTNLGNTMIKAELDVDDNRILAFDLVLNGHIHKHEQITENFWNIGTPIARDKSDIDQKKGFLLFDMKNPQKVVFKELDGFPKAISIPYGTQYEGHDFIFEEAAEVVETEKIITSDFKPTLQPEILLTNYCKAVNKEDLLQVGVSLLPQQNAENFNSSGGRLQLLKLSLEGFLSFSEYTEFELDRGRTLVIIKGKIGKGKTSLLSSIPYTLFGETVKDISAKDDSTWEEKRTKNWQGTRTTIEYIGIDGYHYFVARHLNYEGKTFGLKGSDKLMVFRKVINAQWNKDCLIEARGINSNQIEIEKSLGMSSKVYMQSYYFGQQLTRLIENNKEDNHKLFETLFDVSWVAEAKENAKTQRLKLQSDISEAENELNGAEQSIEFQQSTLQTAENILKQFEENQQKKVAELRKQLQIVENKLVELNSKVEKTNLNANLYDKNAVNEAQLVLNKVSEENPEIVKISKEITEKSGSFDDSSYVSEIQKLKQLLENEIDIATKKYQIFKEEEAKKLSNLEAAENTLKTDFDTVINTLRSKLSSEKDYTNQISEISEKIQRLRNKKTSTATTCPVCFQDIPENKLQVTYKQIDIEIDKENTVLVVLQGKLTNIDNSISELTKEKQELTEKLTIAKNGVLAVKNGIQEGLKVYKEVLATLENNYNPKIAKIQQNLKVDKLVFENSLKDLRTKLTELKSIQQSKIESAKLELNTIKKEQELYKKAIDELPLLKLEYDNLKNQVSDFKKRIVVELNAESPAVDTDSPTKEIQRLLVLQKKITSNLAVHKQQFEAVKWWESKGFGGTGIKPYIFDSGIQRLNSYVPKYAATLGYSVKFEVDTDSANKNFNAYVYYNHRTEDGKTHQFKKKYQEFSGGQKQCVALIISFAMEDLIADNVFCNVIVKDEAFIGLDEEARAAAFELLREKVSNGHSVYIITHSDIIDSIHSKSIYVDADENGSYIS